MAGMNLELLLALLCLGLSSLIESKNCIKESMGHQLLHIDAFCLE